MMVSRERERWLILGSCNDGRVRDKKERIGEWRWERYGGYERLWEIRNMARHIVHRRPRIGIITHQSRICPCHIADRLSTATRNSLKSQLHMMISPIFSDLSLSLPWPQNTNLGQAYLYLCWNSDAREAWLFYLRGPQGQYIYTNIPVRLNAIARTRVHIHLRPYETSPSPAIRDITVSGHMRYHCLRPYQTWPSPAVQEISVSAHTRLLRIRLSKTSLSPTVQDISVSGWDLYMQYSPLLLYHIEQETKQNEKNETTWFS